jgi:hypothetical protein
MIFRRQIALDRFRLALGPIALETPAGVFIYRENGCGIHDANF